MLRAKRGWVPFWVSVIAVCHSVAWAQTPTLRYVNQNRCSGQPECSGQPGGTEACFCNIQDAIEASQSGDGISVVGTEPPGRPIGGPDPTVVPYTGAGNKNLTFGKKAIWLACLGNDATKCVIDCREDGEPIGVGRGFDLSNASSGVVIQGFTIRYCNGNGGSGGGIYISDSSPTITGNIIENCDIDGNNGGGIYCAGTANPMIDRNTIRGNKAPDGFGGGIFVASIAHPTIRGNLIQNNTAGDGGGIFADSDVVIDNCTIQSNTARKFYGGGISLNGGSGGVSTISSCKIEGNDGFNEGGGVYLSGGANATISKCLIAGNSAKSYGGGVCSQQGSTVKIVNSIIANNTAIWQGGGVYLYYSPVNATPTIANTLIVHNRLTESDAAGGGIYTEALSHFDIRNCTIAHNSVPTTGNAYGGGIWLDSAQALITNSILWGNQARTDPTNGPQLAMSGGSVTVRYTDAEGGFDARRQFGGTLTWGVPEHPNIGEDLTLDDPKFVDPDGLDDDPDNDYRVQVGGLAAGNDRGNNEDVVTDIADLDHDEDYDEKVPFDLKGTPRRGDDPDSTATGFPADGFPWVDFGAYEQCGRLSPVVAAAGDNTLKNRSLSMTATENSVTAIRVYLVSLQHPNPLNAPQFLPQTFTAFEKENRWVGSPGRFYESQGPPLAGPYLAARLQCSPYYRDWSKVGEDLLGSTDPADDVFHVVGAEIIPSSTYGIETVAYSCLGHEETCAQISCAVEFTTARWGDVEAVYQTPAPPLTQPDAIDLAQVVNKFGGKVGAPVKGRAQLQPNLPELNTDVNALDIVAVVDAIKGKAYPFPGPCPCPSRMLCRNTACASPAVCVALPPASGGGAGAMCVKTCQAPAANAGEPCINDAHCPGGGPGSCGNGGPTPGFCRDKCGRCNKP
jgi:parallel beta-helix repeat protein/predicted outer membrane repeat protein